MSVGVGKTIAGGPFKSPELPASYNRSASFTDKQGGTLKGVWGATPPAFNNLFDKFKFSDFGG